MLMNIFKEAQSELDPRHSCIVQITTDSQVNESVAICKLMLNHTSIKAFATLCWFLIRVLKTLCTH